MSQPEPAAPSSQSPWRAAVAIVIGLIGSIAIWVVTPYNNYIMASSFIADSYLPVAGLGMTLLLVLMVNPVLRLIRPGLGLTGKQLAVIVGMMLVACSLPGQGMLRMLPYMIARPPTVAPTNPRVAAEYERMDLPPGLFPAPIKRGADVKPDELAPSEWFIGELPEGKSIPWGAWLAPAVTWGGFLLFGYLMMVGLSMIVLPQWRRNERLAFPLATVYQHLIEEPGEKRLFAPLLRRRSFWIAAVGVLVLHVLAGLAKYYPEKVPAIPLDWNVSGLFTEGIWHHVPSYIRAQHIYFIFLGMAFFMPNRIGFSLWFTIIAYVCYRMIGMQFFPPFDDIVVWDQRTGAMLSITLVVLLIGRRQWACVFASLFTAPRNDEDRANRRSGFMFVLGCAGLFAWLLWVGVQPVWALGLVAFAFMIVLLITRIVAETGLPFIRINAESLTFLRLLPVGWLTAATVYFAVVIDVLFPMGSRVNAGAMATQAMALDELDAPKPRSRLGPALVALLMIGLFACGAVHLYGSYHHSRTLSVDAASPISGFGVDRLNDAEKAAIELRGAQAVNDGHMTLPHSFNQVGHIAFGAGLAGVLYWLCLTFPRWPLHPIGMLVYSSYGQKAWASIFIGWFAKNLLVAFGGARLYRAARPFFLGLIMGEVFATIVWAVVPAILLANGHEYKVIEILPF